MPWPSTEEHHPSRVLCPFCLLPIGRACGSHQLDHSEMLCCKREFETEVVPQNTIPVRRWLIFNILRERLDNAKRHMVCLSNRGVYNYGNKNSACRSATAMPWLPKPSTVSDSRQPATTGLADRVRACQAIWLATAQLNLWL